MKTKLRFLMATLILLVVACSKDYDAMTKVENTSTEDAQHSFYVTVDEAVATAKQFLGAGDTRSRDLRLKNHTLYKALSGTRSEGEPIDVVFHVINFEDNQGYAIVSADSRATDVYAFSPTGNIDIDEAMENPGFQIFMNGATANYEDEVCGDGDPVFEIDSTGRLFIPEEFLPTDPPPGSGGGSGPGGGTIDVTLLMVTYLDGKGYYTDSSGWITDENIGPLLSTEWHQNPPYNYYCPVINDSIAVAGCVPIAISQIMAYHKYPPVVNGYSIDWSVVGDLSMEHAYHQAARVIREVGREANSNYGTISTSTAKAKARPTFRAFGYDAGYLESYDEDKVVTSIIDSLPVYTRGTDVVKGVGHAWVIDGYLKNKNVNYYYNMQPPYSLYKTITEYQHYVHCNWGWGSYYNCYCLEDSFFFRERNTPQETHDYDNIEIIPNINF